MMDNKDFFPTPKNLIEQMLKNIDWYRVKSILEPSAGKGDIVDCVIEKFGENYNRNMKVDVDCIEKDENLQKILLGKKHRLVYNDFLTYDTFKRYDLIVMNPPFSDGDQHLLKALKLQENGGAIVCLLNAETLKNPFSNIRKDLVTKLEDYNAEIVYLEDAFSYAERKTNVEIAMIKVLIPEKENKSFIYEELINKEKYTECEFSNGTNVTTNDFEKNIVAQYREDVEAGIRLINEYKALSPILAGRFKKPEDKYNYNFSILELSLCSKEDLSINNFVKRVRSKYWNELFDNEKFTGKLTSDLRSYYSNQLQRLEDYDFSLYNIYTIKIEMLKNMSSSIEDTIVRLFDEFSHKHHWRDEDSKNIHYYSGWKTNKSWIINDKIIMPYLDAFSSYSGAFEPRYRVKEKLGDIEKCFSYLDTCKTKTNNIDLENALTLAENSGTTKKIQLKYFRVTFFKKGTCHIEFTNKELLKKFNIFGSKNKGWLPHSYGKTAYDDMTQEEKQVIDEFEGEESYLDTLINKDYYIVNNNQILMLEDNVA